MSQDPVSIEWSDFQSSGGIDGTILFFGALAVIQVIFWMVIGYRAMRAHERIADSLEGLRREGRLVLPPTTGANDSSE